MSQAQAVKFRLLQGLSVRRAAYSVVKFIMDKGAMGCEVVVTGKLRGQRAKAMKFREGLMIHAGEPTNYYVEKAVKHVHLRQGVIGIKVKIMLPHDPTGMEGVAQPLPDTVLIDDPDKVDPLAMMPKHGGHGAMRAPHYIDSLNHNMTDVRLLDGSGGMAMQPQPEMPPMAQPTEQQMAPPTADPMQQPNAPQPPIHEMYGQQPPAAPQQYGQPPTQQQPPFEPQSGGYNQY